MAETIETYRGTVYPWHCDHMGHMNVMWYVGKFDEGTWSLFLELGMTPRSLREGSRGMAAVEQKLTYKREVHAGDVVAVKTQMVEAGSRKIRFRHAMRNVETGEEVAVCEMTAVHLDTKARKSTEFTQNVAKRIAKLTTTEIQPDRQAQTDRQAI